MQLNKASRLPLRVAVIYVIVAGCWILFSDELMRIVASNPDLLTNLSILKGWGFVLVTGGLLHLGLSHGLKQLIKETEQREQSQMAHQKAVEKLRRSEEQLRLVLESSADGLWDWNLRSGIAELSPRYYEMSGYKAGQVVANMDFFTRLVHPEDRPSVLAVMNEHLAGKSAQSLIQYRMISKDGTEKWIWGRGKVVECDPDGHPLRMVGTITDITQQKQTEVALQLSEQNYREIFDATNDGILILDADTGRLVDANNAGLQMYGYNSKEEFLAGSIGDLSANEPPYTQEQAKGLLRLSDDRGPQVFEWLARKKNGERFWVEVSLRRSQIGDQRRILAAIRDITGRKLVDESHARLATVVEQASEAIVITDVTGVIIYANPAFEKVSGYTCAEVVGQNPRMLKSGKQEAAFYGHMWEVLKRGEVWNGHFINRSKEGTLYEENATISPVRDSRGKIVGYAAIKRDVTHEVQLQAQLIQSQKMEGIGQLAGGVAHDFNNILTSLIMQTELLEMGETLSKQVAEGLEQIRADAHRAAELTRQLLLFSRRQVMQTQNLDLNQLVRNLAKMLQRIIGEDVRLQLDLLAKALTIQADPGMIDQVLMNLAVNARDAMPEGGRLRIETNEVTLNADDPHLNPDAIPGRYVCLAVSDTGSGIQPEVLPRIFEPFFTTKEVGKGTGLGLATVFGIVKQHQGFMHVDNRPGSGVTFKVFLPSSSPTFTGTDETIRKSHPQRGTETILLVEDEPRVRASTRAILELHGYTVLEAANGIEAIGVWHEHRGAVALLVTDLVMPRGMSGHDLARELQADQPLLKVVFLSGYSSETSGRDIGLREGKNFMQKPFSADQLLETVRRVLAGSGLP